MEMEKSKVLIQFLVIFRQFGDVLSFLYAPRLRGYTATDTLCYKPLKYSDGLDLKGFEVFTVQESFLISFHSQLILMKFQFDTLGEQSFLCVFFAKCRFKLVQ